MQSNDSKLPLALQLASEGFRVFPLTPGEKRPPLIHSWQDRASRTHSIIREWWRHWPPANVGLRTGIYKRKHGLCLVVIEIDPRHGGFDWLADHRPLFDPTYVVISGGGGRHFYYWADTEFRNSQNDIAPGVDVRGEGGYVLPAGADHPSGTPYRVGCSLPIAHIGDMLARAITPPAKPIMQAPPAPPAARPSVATILDWALSKVEVGNRNIMAFKLARQLQANGYLGLEGEIAMRSYARSVPGDFDEDEAMDCWFSALKYPPLEGWPDKANKPRVSYDTRSR